MENVGTPAGVIFQVFRSTADGRWSPYLPQVLIDVGPKQKKSDTRPLHSGAEERMWKVLKVISEMGILGF